MYGGLGTHADFGVRETLHYVAPTIAWRLASGTTFKDFSFVRGYRHTFPAPLRRVLRGRSIRADHSEPLPGRAVKDRAPLQSISAARPIVPELALPLSSQQFEEVMGEKVDVADGDGNRSPR
jgi:hypothetical protein